MNVNVNVFNVPELWRQRLLTFVFSYGSSQAHKMIYSSNVQYKSILIREKQKRYYVMIHGEKNNVLRRWRQISGTKRTWILTLTSWKVYFFVLTITEVNNVYRYELSNLLVIVN